MKYALILTYNIAYLPAMCAILNALDYYGHKDLDVHIIYDNDIKPSIDKIIYSNPFCFNIITKNIRELIRKEHCLYINFMFCKYRYIAEIKDRYDAICHLDGDVLLLDNIMKCFEIAAKSGLILCAEFPHTEVSLEYLETHDRDWVAQMYAMANFPIFYNPKLYSDIMQGCWDNMPLPTNSDRNRNNEMYVFNMALFNKADKVFSLPGNSWVGDKYSHHDRLIRSTAGNRIAVFTSIFDRVHIIHNKFWKEGVKEAELSRSGHGGVDCNKLRNNIELIQGITDFFNTRWKIKLQNLL